jgi:hypothetical protein
MKNFTLKILGLFFVGLLFYSTPTRACNLSEMSLVSVTGTGPYVITVYLCVGTGLTGATKGADQSTTTVSFGFWDATPGFALNSFTPAQMFSIAPAQATVPPRCRMTGVNAGPAAIYGTQVQLVYPMPNAAPCTGASATNYGCINSAVLCGPATQNCSTHTFTVNQIPDSIRAFGVEGAGNQVGGCYPNADMLIVFPVLSVEWGDVEARQSAAGVEVKWTTLTETNADYFIVERAVGDGDFESIGEVTALGNSSAASQYTYMDTSPQNGRNRYRIVEVDIAGSSSDSRIIELNFFVPDGMAWGQVGPNPASEGLDVSFYSPTAEVMTMSLMDISGKIVFSQQLSAISGGNALHMDLTTVRPGNYFLSIRGSDAGLVRKVMKL